MLLAQGGFYTFQDILDKVYAGNMQSFSVGDSIAITQVLEFPQKTAVEIMLAFGELDELREVEKQIVEFKDRIGADLVMATGRLGWNKVRSEGWKLVSANYVRL